MKNLNIINTTQYLLSNWLCLFSKNFQPSIFYFSNLEWISIFCEKEIKEEVSLNKLVMTYFKFIEYYFLELSSFCVYKTDLQNKPEVSIVSTG